MTIRLHSACRELPRVGEAKSFDEKKGTPLELPYL